MTLLRDLPIIFLSSEEALRGLAWENLALRQQLAVATRSHQPPRLRSRARFFRVMLSHLWTGWRSVLVIVKPDTVVRWLRKGFEPYWRWRSRKHPGRPPTDPAIRDLIRRMAEANPLWGAPHLHGELLKLGIQISERTIPSLRPRRKPKPPSQTWLTFLRNHLTSMASADFLTVPTATFRVLFVFVVLSHERRRVLPFNVTEHPTAAWTAQQLVEAFPWDTAPRYLLSDRDSIYGTCFRQRLGGMGVKEVLIARHSPWQTPFVERLIGSIRRECERRFRASVQVRRALASEEVEAGMACTG